MKQSIETAAEAFKHHRFDEVHTVLKALTDHEITHVINKYPELALEGTRMGPAHAERYKTALNKYESSFHLTEPEIADGKFRTCFLNNTRTAVTLSASSIHIITGAVNDAGENAGDFLNQWLTNTHLTAMEKQEPKIRIHIAYWLSLNKKIIWEKNPTGDLGAINAQKTSTLELRRAAMLFAQNKTTATLFGYVFPPEITIDLEHKYPGITQIHKIKNSLPLKKAETNQLHKWADKNLLKRLGLRLPKPMAVTDLWQEKNITLNGYNVAMTATTIKTDDILVLRTGKDHAIIFAAFLTKHGALNAQRQINALRDEMHIHNAAHKNKPLLIPSLTEVIEQNPGRLLESLCLQWLATTGLAAQTHTATEFQKTLVHCTQDEQDKVINYCLPLLTVKDTIYSTVHRNTGHPIPLDWLAFIRNWLTPRGWIPSKETTTALL